jgi:hypothetical protein
LTVVGVGCGHARIEDVVGRVGGEGDLDVGLSGVDDADFQVKDVEQLLLQVFGQVGQAHSDVGHGVEQGDVSDVGCRLRGGEFGEPGLGFGAAGFEVVETLP